MLDKAPNKRVADFLAVFGKAISAGDIEKAVSLFQDDCYWRDLVAFTWNIRTMEGKDQVRDMLEPQLAATQAVELGRSPRARTRPRAMASSRAGSRSRPTSRAAWPPPAEGRARLDAADHDDRAERLSRSQSGPTRPLGVRARRRHRQEDLEGRARAGSRRTRLHSRQPYCLIIGGGQGGIGLGGAAEAARRADASSSRRTSGPATAGASATSRSACTTRSGTTICPICRSPKNWPVFSPKDKIGDWLEMYTKVMELNYWGSTECKSAPYRRQAQGMDGRRRARRQGRSCCKPKQLVLATGMSSKPNIPQLPGRGHLQGRAAPFLAASGPDAYAGKSAW